MHNYVTLGKVLLQLTSNGAQQVVSHLPACAQNNVKIFESNFSLHQHYDFVGIGSFDENIQQIAEILTRLRKKNLHINP